MSARRVDNTGSLQNLTVEARQARLDLSADAYILSKNGIEFRSPSPFSPFTEMTVALRVPREEAKVNCTGVVISCTGNKHTGYHVSMVFTGMSKQAAARLSTLSWSQSV